MFDASVLAAYGNVIVVTMNYRLGVLGEFLRQQTWLKWPPGKEGEEEEAGGSLRRGPCWEFCGVPYVMKSFAGPLST
ncbi:Neuroligin-2 Precursor [Collichthys lucidus]|uniref:Neuroligin-2 n=1 Tax=Collichthys lucidus TaxID=240159 RepID=A0A4U5VV54_COLLU|nr:Neuroligin-2 Precursor [Collichthys lucidus]